MSVFFGTADCENLWNPSTIVARTFCDQVASVGRVLNMDTGVGPIVSDEVTIDSPQFSKFTEAFTDLVLRTDPSSGVHLLVGGCFGVVAALARKLGARVPERPTISHFIAAGTGLVG